MLILSRKAEQSIVIQGGITIKILEIEGDRVKLGIDAPSGVRIVRSELLDDVRAENLAAASPLTGQKTIDLRASLRQALAVKEDK